MAAVAVTISITVPAPQATVALYDCIKVYCSTTTALGPFTEVTTAATRIPLVATQYSYSYTDENGQPSNFYVISYFNSSTGAESNLSNALQGTSDPALTIVSIDDLKTNYLIGLDMTTPQGVAFPDSLYEFYIKCAVSNLERRLDMPIRPITLLDERHPYYPEDFRNWCYIQLHQAPCIAVQGLRMQLPGGASPLVFPADSVSLDQSTGVVQVVPGASGTLPVPFAATGMSPRAWMCQRMIPDALRVDYTAGFDPSQVPYDLVELIAKMASFGPLNIAGDLLGGAGIASSSIGIDGLSQSVNTTSSPMFAGYGARLANYTKEIDAAIPVLRRYYKGVGMRVV